MIIYYFFRLIYVSLFFFRMSVCLLVVVVVVVVRCCCVTIPWSFVRTGELYVINVCARAAASQRGDVHNAERRCGAINKMVFYMIVDFVRAVM